MESLIFKLFKTKIRPSRGDKSVVFAKGGFIYSYKTVCKPSSVI